MTVVAELVESKPKPITVDRLDELAAFVVNPPPKSKVEAVIAGLKIIMIFAYLYARKRLMDQDMDEAVVAQRKQAYEQQRTQASMAEIKEDSLDNR